MELTSRGRWIGPVFGVFGFSIGSLVPVFTIAPGVAVLGEPMHPLQLAGAALGPVGVMLVTARPGIDRTRPAPSRRPGASPDA